MIQHHNGALTMVKICSTRRAAGQDAELFTFATDATIRSVPRSGFGIHASDKHEEKNDESNVCSALRFAGGRGYFLFWLNRLHAQTPANAVGSAIHGQARQGKRGRRESLRSRTRSDAAARMKGSTRRSARQTCARSAGAGETSMASSIYSLKKPERSNLAPVIPTIPKCRK